MVFKSYGGESMCPWSYIMHLCHNLRGSLMPFVYPLRTDVDSCVYMWIGNRNETIVTMTFLSASCKGQQEISPHGCVSSSMAYGWKTFWCGGCGELELLREDRFSHLGVRHPKTSLSHGSTTSRRMRASSIFPSTRPHKLCRYEYLC